MINFVFVKHSTDGFEVNPSEEIIRAENLIKVTKWHDDEENKIVFDFYDDIAGKERRFTCNCLSQIRRDAVFRWYCAYLCGGARV